MDILDIISSVFPAVLHAFRAVGFWFLVNEVNHEHQLEEVSRELHEIEQNTDCFYYLSA